MPKVGYSITTTPGSSSQAQTFQSFLNTNLTTWTVSAVHSFGSGGTERNYVVLTHGTYEILLVPLNGSGSDLNNSILSGWYRTGSIGQYDDQPFGIAFSPTGGYAAGFTSGFDPYLNSEFWDGTSSSQVMPMQFWYEYGSECTWYFIENTDRAEMFIYCGKSGSNNTGYGFWGVSSAMIVNDKVPVDTDYNWRTEMMYYFDVAAGTGSPRGRSNHTMIHWTDTNGRVTQVGEPDTNQLSWIGDSQAPNPETSRYESIRHPATTGYGSVSGHVNPQIFREFPQTTSTYGRKMAGVGNDEIFIHIYNDLISPWPSNLEPPTVV